MNTTTVCRKCAIRYVQTNIDEDLFQLSSSERSTNTEGYNRTQDYLRGQEHDKFLLHYNLHLDMCRKEAIEIRQRKIIDRIKATLKEERDKIKNKRHMNIKIKMKKHRQKIERFKNKRAHDR